MRKADTSTRLAVTGVGIICSIGRNRSEVWRSIVESRAGIGKLSKFPGERFPTDVAAEVGDIDDLLSMDSREAKRMSRSDLLAVIAATEAIQQADDGATSPVSRERTVVSTGTSTGGLLEGESFYFDRLVRGRGRVAVSRVLQQPTSGPSDAISCALNLGGGDLANATACSSADAAFGTAVDLLRLDHTDFAFFGCRCLLCLPQSLFFHCHKAWSESPFPGFSGGG